MRHFVVCKLKTFDYRNPNYHPVKDPKDNAPLSITLVAAPPKLQLAAQLDLTITKNFELDLARILAGGNFPLCFL